LASATLGWIPLLQAITGQTQGTSTLLVCAFYEPVYFKPHYDGLLSNYNQALGRWVGVATNVGDALTFNLYTPCNQVIFRSVIQSALDPTLHHKRLTVFGKENNSYHAGDTILCLFK
jgi:hypothetical protein